MNKENDQVKLRMTEWLLIAAFFFAAAFVMLNLGINGPFQTLSWKLGQAQTIVIPAKAGIYTASAKSLPYWIPTSWE